MDGILTSFGPPQAKGNPTAAIGAGAALLSLMLVGLWQLNHLRDVAAWLTTALALFLVYAISGFLFETRAQQVDAAGRPGVAFIFLIALMLRVAGFFLPPALSDDWKRYRWEGEVQQAGKNPYAITPAETGHREVPGPGIRAVYGPLWLLIERAATPLAQAWGSWGMKVPAALAELALAMWMLRRFGVRSVWYVWCPLPIIEFWGQGHNDAVLILLLFATIEATRRGGRPGVWLGLAAAIKWWPLALLPSLALRGRDWLLAIAVLAGCLLPFASGLSIDNARFATGFLGGWRNNDSIFGVVYALSDTPYRAKHVTLLLCGIAVIAIARFRASAREKALWTVTSLLLLSANVHPWYLSWLLPFAIEQEVQPSGERMSAWLIVWLALSPLFYETVIWWSIAGEWRQSPEIRWLVYVPVAVAAVIPFALRRRKRQDGEAPAGGRAEKPDAPDAVKL